MNTTTTTATDLKLGDLIPTTDSKLRMRGTPMSAAIEAGARAWFDRTQAQRLDRGRKRPDGLRWQWDDLTEDDKRAYRALAEPIVRAALEVAR